MTVREMVMSTRTISSEIDVAVSRETYVNHSDPSRLADVFQSDSGGVFWGGAAAFAVDRLRAEGRDVATLSFGSKELNWTHMVVLVKSDKGGWHVTDPYLGNVWADDLVTSIGKLSYGVTPQVIDFGVEREVISEKALNETSWTVGRETARPVNCRGSGPYICEVKHDLHDYLQGNNSGEFLDHLQSLGYPRHIAYAVLLPYGVTTESGWNDVRSISEVVAILESEY